MIEDISKQEYEVLATDYSYEFNRARLGGYLRVKVREPMYSPIYLSVKLNNERGVKVILYQLDSITKNYFQEYVNDRRY